MSGFGLFSQTTIPVLEQVVNFSQARHTVLAGNIANLDTPGYKTRDLSPESFQARLREAIIERDSVGTAGEGSSHGDPFQATTSNLHGIVRHDEGNVGMERQVTEMAKNQMQHNLAMAIMSSQFKLLQAAISERA
ncbi:MAG: flagellar basal body rod protein FlgB [Pirellulales bacterium]